MTYSNTTGAGALFAAGQNGTRSSCWPGSTASVERPRYFPRQLITPDDLTAEQDYFRGKQRRHNRLLHGWGVVCGCKVSAVPPTQGQNTPPDWTVQIEPGYVLGPQGDEILVDDLIIVDLSRQGLDGNAATPCGAEIDPWCSSVRVDRRAGELVYIAVAYTECMARPVRVQAAGCGCDGSACEYSRIRDSFVVRVLTQLPDSYRIMQTPVSPFACPPAGEVRACPDCVDEPWVILAAVKLSGKTIRAGDIDNTTYRRYVASFANWWFTCAAAAPPPLPDPLLTVGAVRIRGKDDVLLYEMHDPHEVKEITLSADKVRPVAIEVDFQNALVDASSVVLGNTFKVENTSGHQPLNQLIKTPLSGTMVRWEAAGLEPGDYTVTLVGNEPPAITSTQGRRLDGEPMQLPSGSGEEGGNFVFRFSFVLASS